MVRALVVDDEQLARRGIVMRLASIPDVEVIGECKNGEEAVAAIAAEAPDLVFLDIQMPGLSGFDVVRRLQADVMPEIVFVTAFDHYAVEAFKVNAIDYILKPVEEPRLREAVERARAVVAARDAVADKARLLDLVLSLEQGRDNEAPTLPVQPRIRLNTYRSGSRGKFDLCPLMSSSGWMQRVTTCASTQRARRILCAPP